MAQTIFETVSSITSSRDSTFNWNPKDLALWANSLKYYPQPENERDMTRHLWDAGRRLFYPRMTSKNQTRWISTMVSRIPELKDFDDGVYVWKGGNARLEFYIADDWRIEVENAVSRCEREGEPVQATVSTYLLKIVSGNY